MEVEQPETEEEVEAGTGEESENQGESLTEFSQQEEGSKNVTGTQDLDG